MKPIKKSAAGFTLLEVVMVLTIVAIAAGMIIPNTMSYISSYGLRSAASELRGNMQRTRISAVRGNTSWAVLFDVANNQYSVCSGSGDGDWTTPGDNTCENPVRLADHGSNIVFGLGNAPALGGSTNPVTFGNAAIFNSRGFLNPPSGFAYLNVTNRSRSAAVGAVQSGAISLRQWRGGNWQ